MKKESITQHLGWFAYFVIVLATAALVAIALVVDTVSAKDLATWFVPLFGTYIGAYLAFRLQERKDIQIKKRVQIDAINRCLLTLVAQYNHLLNYQKHSLDKFDHEDPATPLNLPAERLGVLDSRIKAEELAFLIFHGDENLVLEIAVEQGRFDACVEVISARCAFMVDEIQPLIEKHEMRGKAVSEDELERLFGERKYGTLLTMTDQVYFHVPSTVQSLKNASRRLHSLAKQMFPDERFIFLA